MTEMEYYTWKQQYFRGPKTERLGQAFLNELARRGDYDRDDPILFYQTNNVQAEGRIRAHYLDCG